MSDLLTINPYVTIIGLDFSKAFNMILHSVIADQLAQIEIHYIILYNWIVDYILDRKHALDTVACFLGLLRLVPVLSNSRVKGR